jgi:hypothetical protein
MAARETSPTRELVRVRSHSLTPATEITLKRLSQDASDVLDRAVSDSAILRALLRYVEQQSLSWIRGQLYPHVKEEMNSGPTWGKIKR